MERILRAKEDSQVVRKISEKEQEHFLLAQITELIGYYRVSKDPLLLAEMVDCIENIHTDIRPLITKLLEEKGEIVLKTTNSSNATHQEALFANISVKAVITLDGKILAVQKQEQFGGQWEIPGGRLSEGTKPKQVVKQEVYEELGIDNAEVGNIIGSGIAQPLPGFTSMYYELFLTTIPHQKIQLSDEHQAYQWINKQQLEHLVSSKQFNQTLGEILLENWQTIVNI